LDWEGLICFWNLHEAALWRAAVICRADLGAKDELRTRRENHVGDEARRALERKFVECPYLARQLSMFEDQ
jgi:hypothetical protein